VWQDYLEAWYPEDRAFSLKAARLYDPLIRYVRNHPCVASWTTCDEESLENYRDLTKHLAPRPALLDPSGVRLCGPLAALATLMCIMAGTTVLFGNTRI
jgi:hypothetical protein